MYSVFGLAAMSGTVIVDTLQHKIGYSGMLIVCLMFTSTAALFTIFYNFEQPLSYKDLMQYIQKGDTSKDDEKGSS